MLQTVFRFRLRTFFLRNSRLLASPIFWRFRINSATFFARHRRNSLHRLHHLSPIRLMLPSTSQMNPTFSPTCALRNFWRPLFVVLPSVPAILTRWLDSASRSASVVHADGGPKQELGSPIS